MSEKLELALLGQVEVRLGNKPVKGFYSHKAQALLYYLAVRGLPQSRTALAGLLWADRPESDARMNLRQVLTNLRRLLGPYLNITRQTVAFNRESNYWLDVEHFQAEAEGLIGEAKLARLAEAVELYRGDFLEGFFVRDAPLFEEWLLAQRAQLRLRALEMLHKLVAYYTQQGDYERGLATTRRLLILEPWQEEAHRELMLLLVRVGQREAALAHYQTCRQMLNDELGIEPTAETQTLYKQIRTGELETLSQPPWSVRRRNSPPHAPSFLNPEIKPEPGSPPLFVARERELARMNSYLEAALAGRGQVIFVSGDAGSGKTALLQAFAHRAQAAHPNLVVAAGNCNAISGAVAPYFPFREVLGMLSGEVESRWKAGTISRENARRLWSLLPQTLEILMNEAPALIDVLVPGPSLLARAAAAIPSEIDCLQRLRALIEWRQARQDNPSQSQLLEQYSQGLRALAEAQPLLLLLDDMQWVDTASIALLFYLGRRGVSGSRILIVSAYRPDEIVLDHKAERHPLAKTLAEFKRYFGDIWVDLMQVEETERRAFINALLATEPNGLDTAFREALFRRTRGHPLFTIELLRAMQERGDLIQDETGRWVAGSALDWGTLPARVEGVIEERVGRLAAGMREILSIAAVEGEMFTIQVLARVQNLSERAVFRLLSQASRPRHGLVREGVAIQLEKQRLSTCEFSHGLFQQYFYNTLNAGERRLLHGEVGITLEALYREQVEVIAPQLARHFAEGGNIEKAVYYLLLAGDQARLLYAHQEAVNHYQQALALLEQQAEYERAGRTLMRLGLTYHNAFDFALARQAYEKGFALGQRVDKAKNATPLQPAPHALRVDWRDPPTLDPTKSGNFWSAGVIGQLFSGLVELSPEMEILPEIAHAWEVLGSGGKYIFHLRDDVCWSDGVPVTAGDFEYAWKQALSNPDSPLASLLLDDIKNARAFCQGEISDPDQVGVRACDETTLVVELEEPTPYFLHVLAHPATFPVPRHTLKVYGEAWAKGDNLVTNGPFRLDLWQPGEFMRFSRNPGYQGRFTGNLQQVELWLITDPFAKLAMYEGSTLDVFRVWFLPPQDMNRARQQSAGEYVSGPQLITVYLGFDVTLPPFDDPRVRRAFVLATDREKHAEIVRSGQHTLATGGFVPSGMPGHSPGIGLPYNPAAARQLLAEAGYPEGRGFSAVKLLAANFRAQESEQLAAYWRENLAVEIVNTTVEAAISSQVLAEARPHLFLHGWAADYPDPDSFLRLCVRTTLPGWRNKTYESLVARARYMTTQEKRMELYRQADRLLVEEAVALPLTYSRVHLLVKPWVRRYPISVMRGWFWKDIIIEPH